MFKRSSGILLHITSLPSKKVIGDFGKESYEFIDFLESAGQKLWQILPLGPTGYGDSPYQSFSSFAGNPYFIDLDELVTLGLLTEDDVKILTERNNEKSVDYGVVYSYKLPLLKKSYNKFCEMDKNHEMDIFKKKNSYWLEDYSIFMALKDRFQGSCWTEWPMEYKNRDEITMENLKKELKKEIDYYNFLQYMFFNQWNRIKNYANSKQISIIGDIPIFVALDSSDAWAQSDIFYFDKEKNPLKVAGCPPDAFSKDGQLWGNPLYNWEVLEKKGYSWWIERVEASFEIYDIVRIDHFRGFESYWEIPKEAKTAVKGHWKKGPGMKLFNAIKKKIGEKAIIAEDLGFLTLEVKQLLKDSGYPGMKVLLFAFDSIEDSDYLIHKYPKNSVAYVGTHDNETVVGWYERQSEKDKKICEEYLKKIKSVHSKEINWEFIEAVWGSASVMALTQMQDIIGLDNSARMNKPSTTNGNWSWRVYAADLSEKNATRLKEVTIKNSR